MGEQRSEGNALKRKERRDKQYKEALRETSTPEQFRKASEYLTAGILNLENCSVVFFCHITPFSSTEASLK